MKNINNIKFQLNFEMKGSKKSSEIYGNENPVYHGTLYMQNIAIGRMNVTAKNAAQARIKVKRTIINIIDENRHKFTAIFE